MTNGESREVPQFMRAVEREYVELRGDCPRRTVNVLDAVSMARDQSRTALVNEILSAWAEKVVHESTLVHRVAGGNPPPGDAVGGARP